MYVSVRRCSAAGEPSSGNVRRVARGVSSGCADVRYTDVRYTDVCYTVFATPMAATPRH
jgi:hypothetical protein